MDQAAKGSVQNALVASEGLQWQWGPSSSVYRRSSPANAETQ